MRIIKRIPNNLVEEDYLLAKISYKKSLILMNGEETVYKDITNSKKKEQFNQTLILNKPYLYISPSQLLILTAIKKDEKGYVILDELEKSKEKNEYILSRIELENYLSEREDKVFIQGNNLTYNISLPTEEELLEIYKKEFSDYVISSLTQAEKNIVSLNEYVYMKEYSEKISTLKNLINKMSLEDMPSNYNLNKIFGNIVICQRCNNQLQINVLEIYYLEKDKYKIILTNVPIKEYKPKTKNKVKEPN